MSTDLRYWEASVPAVNTLYQVFVAVGWGLLIGNCAFQAMKAMFAGLGFETESPAILLFRTGLFGVLLIFSKEICEIGLSLGKHVIDLLDFPDKIVTKFPDKGAFGTFNGSWTLVVIVGFVLGIQLLRLIFGIGERYVVVAILTLLSPVGLAMGGSKSTKDICVGFIRTYASMVVMLVINALFLKLVVSAMTVMPPDILVLPWCLLIVGIARTARRADNLITKIGLTPAITSDPLGGGKGIFVAMTAAKMIMSGVSKARHSSPVPNSTTHSSLNSGITNNNVRNAASGGTVPQFFSNSSENVQHSFSGKNANAQNIKSQYTNSNGNIAASQSSTSRFGVNSYSDISTNPVSGNASDHTPFKSSHSAHINTNRFGVSPIPETNGQTTNSPVISAGKTSEKSIGAVPPQKTQFGKNTLGEMKPSASSSPKENIRHNENPFHIGKNTSPQPTGKIHMNPISFNSSSAQPDQVPDLELHWETENSNFEAGDEKNV
ncbi:hypothetical protein [Massiliimalia massiliensis]|uniref:hypothetical protein n=1 Tax=Massiliimalia massiliensis TaxID=1852384 RepID=UPI001179A4B6|nr:hypothetical protein [Massiliimalia massiliensis]